MQVAVHDLKAHLSRFLSRAQAGESIEVTSHNRLIARIVGVPAGTAEELREKGLAPPKRLSENVENSRSSRGHRSVASAVCVQLEGASSIGRPSLSVSTRPMLP